MSQHHWEQHDRAVEEVARVLRAIYDLRFVPRDPLVSAASAAGVPLETDRVGAGHLPLRPYLRFTVRA